MYLRYLLDGNAGIATPVSTGEADGGRRSGSTTSNTDLSAAHVELSTGVGASSMESDDLTSEEVVTSRNAAGDPGSVLALVGNELIDGPGLTAQTILLDLEPPLASSGSRPSISNLGTVVS